MGFVAKTWRAYLFLKINYREERLHVGRAIPIFAEGVGNHFLKGVSEVKQNTDCP
jgi:hypothetical protein